MTGPELHVGNLVGYFTLDTSDLDRARTSVTGGLGDIRTQGARAAGAAGAAIGAALTGGVVDAARDIGRAGQRAGAEFSSGITDATRGAITAVDKLRAQAVLASDKAAAAMSRYEQAVKDAAAGNAAAQRDVRRLGAEATIAGADAERAMDQYGAAAKKAADDVEATTASTKKSFAGIGDAAKGAIAGLGLGTVLAKAMDADDASRKLTAQLHLSAEEAGRFGKDAGALYSGNFADSLEDANEAIRSVVANIGGMRTASDADLQSITGQVSSLAQTFDQDLGGVTAAVGQMMRTGMAKDAQEALDIITAGFQAGDDKAGDLLDTLNEYPVQFQKAGIDGKIAMGLITQGLQGGARDSDLVADNIKEIGINLLDTGSNAAVGLQQLGLNAQQVMGMYKMGGSQATAALQMIFDRVHDLGGATKNMGALANIASSQIEDMGSSFDHLNTKDAAQSLGDVAGRAKELTDTVGGSASGAISSFWKSLQTTATTIGGQLLPQLTPLLPALQDVAGVASTLVGAFVGLPEPLKNAGLAFGAILLLKGPLLGFFGQVQARAAAAAATMFASTNSMVRGVGGAVGGVSRLAGFLGGPWGVAIGLGVTALASWIGSNHDSEEAVAANKGRIDALAGTLDTITGKLTTASAVKIGQDWISSKVADQFKNVEGGAAAAATSIVLGGKAIDDYRAKLIAAAGGFDSFRSKLGTKDMDAWSQATRDSGISTDQLIATVQRGGDSLDGIARKIAEANRDAADPTLRNVDDIKARLTGLVGGLDGVVPGLRTFNDEVVSSSQASTMAADSIRLQKDATDKMAAAEKERQKVVGSSVGNAQSANAAEAGRARAIEDSTGNLQSANAAEAERAKAVTATAQAVGSASSAEHDVQGTYTASMNITNDLVIAQVDLAKAVKDVHDAPTKDFAAMEASIKGVTDQTSKASTETNAFAIEIDKLTGRNVPLQDATKALNDRVRDLAATFGDAQGIVDAHAASLVNDKGVIDTTTEAGSKLYDSVSAYSDAYNTSTTAAMDAAGANATVAQKVAAARTAADKARDMFIKQATALGLSDEQAGLLADSMGILEGKRLTPKTLHLDAQDQASSKVDDLNAKVQGLQDKVVRLTVDASGGTVRVQSDGSFKSGDKEVAGGFADGGYINVGTGPRTDDVHIKASRGEFVTNALATAKNRKALEYANAGGVIPGFANGGYVNYRMGMTGNIDTTLDSFTKVMGNADASGKAANAAAAAAAKAAAAIPAASSGVQQWIPLMTKVITEKLGAGAVAHVLPIMAAQMQHESSGNPAAINLTDINAQNGHPSVGLLQFIPSTFKRFADPGYNSNIYDPESQMRAFINYVPSNYGSFDYLTRIGNGAYAKGGAIEGAGSTRSDSVPIRASRGEFITSALATAKNRKALEYANAGGVIPGFADGGYVTGGQVAGQGGPQYGDRLGRVVEGLAALAQQVADARAAVADSRAKEADAWDTMIDARKAQASASKEERAAAAGKTKAAEREYRAAVMQRQAADYNARTGAGVLRTLQANIRLQKTAAAQFDRVKDALADAGDKLQNLKVDRAQVRDSVAGTVAGFGGGITGNSDTRRTGSQVASGLRYDLQQITGFRNDLAKAAKNGLDPALLAEIAGKGVEGGGTTARALAGASRGDIANINATQKQILAMSMNAGNTVASYQFNPLIRSQQKLVDSLAGSLSNLEKLLDRNGPLIAKAVAEALSRFHLTLDAQGLAVAVNAGNKQLARRG